MEKYLIRIATINLNDNLALLRELSTVYNFDYLPNDQLSKASDREVKEYFLELAEEMDSSDINIRFQALAKILLAYVIDTSFNFMKGDKLEQNFDEALITKSNDYGILNDLIRNLSYFHLRLYDYQKDELNISKCRLIFFLKINLLLIFLMLYFLRHKTEIKYLVKFLSEDFEDTMLKLFKIFNTYKYIPCKVLLCLYSTFISILLSENNDDNNLTTCRKIVKKDRFLTRSNYEIHLRPSIPKIFQNYEADNNFIEKFYRRNMLKREKSDLERVIIVSILKILLSTLDNNSNANYCEYIKDYIPETILFNFYVKKSLPSFSHLNEPESDLNYLDGTIFSEIVSGSSEEEKEMFTIMELINKISITAIILAFYFLILKSLQKYDLVQYSIFCYYLKDSNGLLLFIKILNLDYKSIEEQFMKIYSKDTLHIQFGQMSEMIILFNLKLIHKICFSTEEYIVRFLVDCKVPIMLKKILSSFGENEKINKASLKLFKCQLKYYDKNWRMDNVNIITSIYLNLKLGKEKENFENYLERKDKSLKDISPESLSLEELMKIHAEYHQVNYIYYMNNPEEYEKYVKAKQHSVYANIYMKLNEIVDNNR